MGFLRGHTTTTRANKISEFTVSTAEYGSAVPEVLGTVRIAGNIIYYDDFTAHEHKEVQRAGKGGGSKHVNINYTYSVAAILGLCEGEINGVNRVWVGKDVYNYPNEKIQMTVFTGSQNQQPWAYTQGKHPEKALAYPGLAYVAGVVDLGDSGAFPSYNFEVKGKLLNTGDGIDVNPADYIRYVLDKAGLKDVEIQGLENYRQYCREADILISTPPDEKTKTARDIVNEIAQLTNAYIFWSNDQFKIVPLADRPVGNWMPNKQIIYDLTSDDFIPQSEGELVRYERKDGSENYNQFPVEFINRSNGYEKETVTYQFSDDIKKYGSRQAGVFSANYIYTKERAVKIAEQIARINFYGRNRYTFKLDWCFCRLEVGDLVTLTDEYSGMEKQVAVISEVTEDQDGLLLFRAISMPDGDYEPAQYDVHENDRPYINMNDTACDTVPVMFQPPADMTRDGLELWIAAKGKEKNWGGCSVYISDDNEHYIHAGDINNSSRLGQVKSYGEDKIKVSCNGQLLSGTAEDAERGNTMCWIGGECLSYTMATLQNDGSYLLEGLVRGQYNTVKAKHSAGEPFVRLDNYLLKIPFAKNDIGKKIYLKFVSKNIFGAGEQDLSDVKAYEYKLQRYFIPPVTDITAYNRYRELADGVSRYDIVVKWIPPELQTYLQGDVWYKTSNGQSVSIAKMADVPVSEIGFQGEWTYGGSGKNEVVIPQAVVGDTYLIAVCTKDTFGEVTSPDSSPQIKILVALKTETPNTPDGFTLEFGTTATASWQEVTNTDVAFYEIRLDANAGEESANLLARTNNLSAILPLTERKGKLYLFARSAIGKYSAPAILEYNKLPPKKPNPPKLKSTLRGFGITAEPIPSGAVGMTIYIDGTDGLQTIKTVNNTYSYSCDAGIYDVTIAYYDIFGEGEQSGSSRVVVKPTIPKEWIDKEQLGLTKVENAIKDIEKTFPRLDNIGKEIEKRIASGAEKVYQSKIDKIDERIASGAEQFYESKIKGDVESRIVQMNDVITQNVNNKIAGVESRITQLDGTITQSVNNRLTGVESKITQLDDTITQNVNNKIAGVESRITQLSDTVNITIDNKIKGLSTQMTQLEGTIYQRVSKNVNGKIDALSSRIVQTESAIYQNVDNKLAGVDSKFTQLSDNINFRVTRQLDGKADKANLIGQINICPEATTIDGRFLHVTGDTLFDKDVIVNRMLSAKAVTADKLDVNELSAITANIGLLRTATSGARTEISNNLIEVYDNNGRLRVRMGVW